MLREHGLTMTRSFFFWPDFMPDPEAVDEDMAARFADFLDRHAEAGMTTVPTFIVGHMSGENWRATPPSRSSWNRCSTGASSSASTGRKLGRA